MKTISSDLDTDMFNLAWNALGCK